MYIVHTSFVSFETPLQFIAYILQGFVDPKCKSQQIMMAPPAAETIQRADQMVSLT